MEPAFPYNLPIWRSAYRAQSPDRRYIAEINPAHEVSMGNPTCGTLRITNGLTLSNCNPSFLWSDDSTYLAVPRYFKRFALFRRQRLVIIDVAGHTVYTSKMHARYFQPKSFVKGSLIVTIEPFRTARDIIWRIPEDFVQFLPLMVGVAK